MQWPIHQHATVAAQCLLQHLTVYWPVELLASSSAANVLILGNDMTTAQFPAKIVHFTVQLHSYYVKLFHISVASDSCNLSTWNCTLGL